MDSVAKKLIGKLLKIKSIKLYEDFDFNQIHEFLESQKILGLIGEVNRDNGDYRTDVALIFYFSMDFNDEMNLDKEIQDNHIQKELISFDEEMQNKFDVVNILKHPRKYQGPPNKKILLHTIYSISDISI